jgi:hypothetical protein
MLHSTYQECYLFSCRLCFSSELIWLHLFYFFSSCVNCSCRYCYWQGQTILSHESTVFCYFSYLFLLITNWLFSDAVPLGLWDVLQSPHTMGRRGILFLSNMNNGGMKKQPAAFIQRIIVTILYLLQHTIKLRRISCLSLPLFSLIYIEDRSWWRLVLVNHRLWKSTYVPLLFLSSHISPYQGCWLWRSEFRVSRKKCGSAAFTTMFPSLLHRCAVPIVRVWKESLETAVVISSEGNKN